MKPLIRVPFNYGLDVAASKGIGFSDGAPPSTNYQLYRLGSDLYWNGISIGTTNGAIWGNITGTLSNQTDLNSALSAKAPITSPAFGGTPTAPTPLSSDSSTTIATTAFVQGLVSAVSITYNAVVNALGYTPANKNGDTFTGNVIVPDLSVNGMMKPKVSFYNVATTLSLTDNIVIINSLNAIDITLPTGVNNYSYRIRNNGGYTVTIVTSSGNTINGVTSFDLLPNNALSIVFYNGNWHLF